MAALAIMAGGLFTVAGGGNPATVQAAVLPSAPEKIEITQQDLEFIIAQIAIAEAHADGSSPLCSAPNRLTNALACVNSIANENWPWGLRQVDGKNNNLFPGQANYGSADQLFPRLTTPVYKQADPMTFDAGTQKTGDPTSYDQNSGIVVDKNPRLISDLISDQTENNPAATAAAAETIGHGFGSSTILVDHDRNSWTPPIKQYVMPNVAPDAGFSASYNSLFTMFGQFFDHGLDLVQKGGSGTVMVPLQPDDPLYVAGSNTNFMVLTRSTKQAGPDGILGTADDIKDSINQVTPYIDENQTYTSHPAHQVFVREYRLNFQGLPVSSGNLLSGADGGLPTWHDVKQQALTMLGIKLNDSDIFDVPLIYTDAYGKFIPGPNGYPQVVTTSNTMIEGDPANPVDTVAVGAARTGHAFLNDIAHSAVPDKWDNDNNPNTPDVAKTPDTDTVIGGANLPGTYDDELLDRHYICGDGRCNENIGLTAIHQVFHSEHNGLVQQLEAFIPTIPSNSPAALANWQLGGEWNGERIFQAAKFIDEMEYQHIALGEFARVVSPQVNAFDRYAPNADPAITAEFAHAVYRFGHSMLTETVARKNADGSENDIPLMTAFLNPVAFTDGGTAGKLTATQGAGAIIRGMVNQRGEAIDEFLTEALRNNLVGLPLDLGTLNLTRARSEGIAPLNVARRDLYTGTVTGAAGNPDLKPYDSWFEYSLKLRHQASLVNFIAAYGTHPTIVAATTIADKRAAAQKIVDLDPTVPDANDFLMSSGAWALDSAGHPTTGLDDVDMWIGGLAEAPPLFGGMLGSTFNFVFTHQMEALQDSDRMYYLARTAGLPLVQELERTTFSKLVRRNTDAENVPVLAFTRPDYTFDLTAQTNPTGITDDPNTVYNEKNLDGVSKLVRMPDGTIRLTGKGTTENHSTWLGTNGDDKVQSAEGDDSLWGNDGNDHLDGGVGADFIDGGAGNDFLSDPAGLNNIDGGAGNDVIMAGNGTDNLLGGPGVDAIFGASGTKTVNGGTGDDLVLTGTGADDISGGPGMDWLEGGDGNDLFSGDERAAFALNQGEDDVFIGGKGDDKYLGEGGTDIAVIGEGNDTYVGGLGFDFATYVRDPLPAFGDLSLPPAVAGAVAGAGGGGLANPRDRFSRVEGLSGGAADDHLRGDNTAGCGGGGGGGGAIACAPGVALVKDSLSQESIDRIPGLQNLLLAGGMYNPAGSVPAPPVLPGALPPGGAPTVFTGDDILMGGAGSDTIESSGGDDLIDGDAYLDVWLECTYNDGTVKDVNSLGDVRNDLWSGILTPDNCIAHRAVKYPADTTGTDTVVYHFSMALATIVQIGDGRTLVTYPTAIGARAALVPPVAGGGGAGGGGATQFSTDTLLNIEQLQFSDGTMTITPPVIGPGGGLDPNPPVGTVVLDNTAPNVADTITATSNVTDADGIVAGTEDFQLETVVVDPTTGGLTTSPLGNAAPVAAAPGTPASASFVIPPNAQGLPVRVVYSYLDTLGNFGSVPSDITAPVGAAAGPVTPPATPTLTLGVPPLNTPDILVNASFLDAAGQPIVGATVTFTIDAQTFTGTTDVNGNAQAATILTTAPGAFVTFNASAVDPASNATITANQQIAQTTYPGFSMNPIGQSVLEGAAGTQTPIGATITLDHAMPFAVTVDWEAVAGTATAGADFVAATGTATVPAGQQSVDISTMINGDNLVEPDETIVFNIVGSPDGVLGTITSATSTILDDDLPTLSFGAAPTVTEGVTPDGAASVVSFDLTLDQAPTNAVSVPWHLVPGSAQPGTDYLDASGIAAFSPGQTTAHITVTLVNDTVVEPTEQFSVQLGVATGATMPATTSQTATILDDDVAVLSAGPAVSVVEGDIGARNQLGFTLQLDRPSIHPVQVSWVAGGGTATTGVDFTGTGGTVTIPAGATSLVVPVTVIGDRIREADETVPFQITGVTNAVVGQVSTIGTILDDDSPQTISINSVSTLEGNVGTHMLTFTLTLDRTARRPISVLVRTMGGSARTPSDFATRSAVVTFAPGQQTATFDVPIVGDRVKERNESFSVRLSRPVNVRIVRGIGTGVIINDD